MVLHACAIRGIGSDFLEFTNHIAVTRKLVAALSNYCCDSMLDCTMQLSSRGAACHVMELRCML